MIRGSDFLLLRDTSLTGVSRRAKEYGTKYALAQNKGVIIGIVCSFNGENLVVTLGDEPAIHRLQEIQSEVVKVYRNNAYLSEFKALELEESTMAMYSNIKQYKTIKEHSKGNPGSVFSYILTSANIMYPTAYANLEMSLSDFFTKENGFYEVT